MTDTSIMLAKTNGTEKEKYPEFVEEEVRQTYLTSGSEIAILRKAIKAIGESKGVKLPQEFLDYYNEVEQKKEKVKEELGIE